LNESNGNDGTLAGAEITGTGSGNTAAMAADGALPASAGGDLMTGESKLALFSCG